MKNRILTLALAVVLGLMLLPGCQQQTAETPALEKITVSEVARSVFYAPQYAAITQGFFAEEGLDIELITGQGADKVMTAVLSGQVEIGFSGPEAAVYVMQEGRENYPVVFAQLTKRDGAFLVGREPAPPEGFSFEQLRGSYLIGGRKGGVPLMTLEYVLRQNGLEPNVDLTVDSSVQFALMAGAFTGGQGDYVALFEPTASAVEREGKGYVLASIGEQSGEIPYTCYYASSDFLAENSDLIQRFTNAIYKGQQWVASHTPREVAEAIAPFFPDNDLDLLEMVCRRHAEIDAFMSTPVMTEEAFDRLQTVMEQAGELEKRVDFRALVDNRFAEAAVASLS
ncbi:MAG: hypothetical protein DBX44_02690 [Oscillospiraceae bacterium]|nr:MAG: hypothetical protein DBX44_02690 [Oscillospiraceae bacterium]